MATTGPIWTVFCVAFLGPPPVVTVKVIDYHTKKPLSAVRVIIKDAKTENELDDGVTNLKGLFSTKKIAPNVGDIFILMSKKGYHPQHDQYKLKKEIIVRIKKKLREIAPCRTFASFKTQRFETSSSTYFETCFVPGLGWVQVRRTLRPTRLTLPCYPCYGPTPAPTISPRYNGFYGWPNRPTRFPEPYFR